MLYNARTDSAKVSRIPAAVKGSTRLAVQGLFQISTWNLCAHSLLGVCQTAHKYTNCSL